MAVAVQPFGLDKVEARVHLGRLKLYKVQLACVVIMTSNDLHNNQGAYRLEAGGCGCRAPLGCRGKSTPAACVVKCLNTPSATDQLDERASNVQCNVRHIVGVLVWQGYGWCGARAAQLRKRAV